MFKIVLNPRGVTYININSDRYQSRQSNFSIRFTLNILSRGSLYSTLSARKNHEQGLNSLPGQELAKFLQPEGNEARKNSPIFLQQEGNCKENARTQEHRRNSSPETSLEFTFNSLLRRTDSSSSILPPALVVDVTSSGKDVTSAPSMAGSQDATTMVANSLQRRRRRRTCRGPVRRWLTRGLEVVQRAGGGASGRWPSAPTRIWIDPPIRPLNRPWAAHEGEGWNRRRGERGAGRRPRRRRRPASASAHTKARTAAAVQGVGGLTAPPHSLSQAQAGRAPTCRPTRPQAQAETQAKPRHQPSQFPSSHGI